MLASVQAHFFIYCLFSPVLAFVPGVAQAVTSILPYMYCTPMYLVDSPAVVVVMPNFVAASQMVLLCVRTDRENERPAVSYSLISWLKVSSHCLVVKA